MPVKVNDIYLDYNKIKVIENLPKLITGNIWLNSNNINYINFNDCITIKGDIHIHVNPIENYFLNSGFITAKEWFYDCYLMKMKLQAWNNL